MKQSAMQVLMFGLKLIRSWKQVPPDHLDMINW